MRVAVEVNNLRIPLDDFGREWDRAESLSREAPDSRYLGGVVAALRWVATFDPRAPLSREIRTATVATIRVEQIEAESIAYQFPGYDPGIDQRWATGVLMALCWTSGMVPGSPVAEMPAQQAG